jgi:hypothetical protein
MSIKTIKKNVKGSRPLKTIKKNMIKTRKYKMIGSGPKASPLYSKLKIRPKFKNRFKRRVKYASGFLLTPFPFIVYQGLKHTYKAFNPKKKAIAKLEKIKRTLTKYDAKITEYTPMILQAHENIKSADIATQNKGKIMLRYVNKKLEDLSYTGEKYTKKQILQFRSDDPLYKNSLQKYKNTVKSDMKNTNTNVVKARKILAQHTNNKDYKPQIELIRHYIEGKDIKDL